MSTLQPNILESQSEFSPVFSSPEGGLILIRTTQQDQACNRANRTRIKAFNSNLKQAVIFPPSCKQWDCPVCAPKNAYKVRLRAIEGYENFVSEGRKFDFLTLTPHERLSSAASIPVMASAWNKLNVRIKRASQFADYFLIPELHQSGKLHFHALVDAELKKKWWKDNARTCGMGYQNDLQEVHEIGGVGGYLTKYIAKMLQNSNFPRGFRRVRASYSWPSLPVLPRPEGWNFVTVKNDVPLQHEIEAYKSLGYAVVIADEISSWAWIDGFGSQQKTPE